MITPGMFISDRYEIIDKVGSGGMADVYKAKCHRLNRYVAIKILKPEYSSDTNFVHKFRGEAQSAAGLSHPNIVSVYDVGDDNGLYYIVMELVEGITLKRFIERKGRLEIREAVGIAIQIAQGMEAAHANNIIHRDIKPQNIIISRDGKVKVADFGIAKAPSTNTVTQSALGSVHYLSPEQARGGYSDERSDIYSLGVTLYEMLCGQVPFAGDNSVSIALSHIQSEAVPVNELNPNVSNSLSLIVQKCMQKKPERRYQSASELILDLKRSLSEPDGGFVDFSNPVVNDSPTRQMTEDELGYIKSAAKSPTVYVESPKKGRAQRKIEKEEEEELDTIDSRLEKVLIALSVIAAIALCLVIFFVVGKFLGFFGSEEEDSEVTPTEAVSGTPAPTGDSSSQPSPTPTPTLEPADPSAKLVTLISVVGYSMDDAKKTLEIISDKFNVVFADEEYSDDVDYGLVMKQYPMPSADGQQIAENTTITLVLSAGPKPKELPALEGKTVDQAKVLLETFEFVVSTEYIDDATVEKDLIVKTEPAAGSEVAKGGEVILYVSKGQEPAAIPDIMGLSESKARKKIESEGFVVGTVSSSYNADYKEGKVCYQNYAPGDLLPPGTVIDFSLSLGKEPEATTEPTTAPEVPETDEGGSGEDPDNPVIIGD